MLEDRILGLLPVELAEYATIGDFPTISSNAIAIIILDGDINLEYFGNIPNPTIYRPVVKVVVRNVSYEEGRGWIDFICKYLHRSMDSNNGVLSIFSISSPVYLGRDEHKFNMFQLSFKVSIIRSEEVGS